jgi:hypothetical protein
LTITRRDILDSSETFQLWVLLDQEKQHCKNVLDCTRALGQGLSVIAVSLTAERANQIGGVHAHNLFCFGVRKYIGAGKMAETAWVKLLTRPKNLEVIRRVDVLLWDEVLNCSDYFLHTVDMLFRMVKINNIFMGGVLMIGTGDRRQTQPIDGRPLLTSPSVIGNFLLHELKTPVRASGHLALQHSGFVDKVVDAMKGLVRTRERE